MKAFFFCFFCQTSPESRFVLLGLWEGGLDAVGVSADVGATSFVDVFTLCFVYPFSFSEQWWAHKTDGRFTVPHESLSLTLLTQRMAFFSRSPPRNAELEPMNIIPRSRFFLCSSTGI